MTEHKNEQLHVCTIFGTRPEAIKMAPVVLELNRRPEIRHTLVVSGQHRDMLHQMLRLFELTPDFDLDIMSSRQTLSDVTVKILRGMEEIFSEIRPDIVLVHGDTSTSFVSALAAYYAKIPVGHVEAGLRTGDKYNPFPEEMNRHLIDVMADMFFPPTQNSLDQLRQENLNAPAFVTGNTVIDALLSVTSRKAPEGLLSGIPADADVVMVEAHRRENWGEPMRQICLGIKDLASAKPDLHVVFPVHMNPVVRDTANEILSGIPSIHLIEPQDYLPFVFMMKRAKFIITDSGGIQEEAPSLGTPVLVLREKTERPEAVAAGTAIVVGPDRKRLLEESLRLIDDKEHFAKMSGAKNPYGDGRASSRIADALLYHFGKRTEPPEEFSPEYYG